MANATPGKFTLQSVPNGMQVSVLESNPEIATLIGHVVGRWAMVERLLAVLVRRAIKCDQNTAEIVLFSLGNFKARLDITRNSVIELMHSHPRQEEILWLLERIQGASDVRNKLIHGTWMIDTDGKFVRRIRRPGSKQPILKQTPSAAEIKDHLDKIGACIIRLLEIVEELSDSPPKKRRAPLWSWTGRKRLRLSK